MSAPLTPTNLKRLAVMYPSGNTTAVVFDDVSDCPREALNDQIMKNWKQQYSDHPEIEQCCFVTKPQNPTAIARVEMFGGEFCGNATRSVIQLLTEGNDSSGLIEVSGANKPLQFSVKAGEISVVMPLPQHAQLASTVEEGMLVHLDGIEQLVVIDTARQKKLTSRQLLETLLQTNKYNLANQPAVGVSYYDPASAQALYAVWVKDVNTIFDETACGSGTCAIGIVSALASNTNIQGLAVVQPSGETIQTDTTLDTVKKIVTESRITGAVKTLYDGPFTLT